MPPKIEEIPPKPNPFLSKKKTTVRRDAKEVYGTENLRKGLNEPQYSRGTPLDKLFLQLESIIDGTIDEITLDTMAQRMNRDKDADFTDEFLKRYTVISNLLDFLVDIKHFSLHNQVPDKNLISISLHDIKTFSKLVNLIVVHGVYPALNTFKVGIPLGKRRLNDFMKTKKPVKIVTLPQNTGAKSYVDRYAANEKLLTLLYNKFKSVFTGESDVRDLLVKGTGYSDFLTISITLITCPYFPQENKQKYLDEYWDLVIQLPGTFELFQTFSLYISSPSPAYFKQFVMKNLQLLHYNAPKKDGLLTLIEFVLGLRDNEEINVEKFDNVANVVLAKPQSVPTVDYFSSMGTQFFDLLVNINRPYVTSCVGHVLERLWQRNRLVMNDFFLKKIWDILNTDKEPKDGIITSEKDLNNVINVLISLTKKGLSPELTQYLFQPILHTLWCYFVFLKKSQKPFEVVLNILVSYFVVVQTLEDKQNDLHGLDFISRNLLANQNFVFELGPNSLPQISIKSSNLGESRDTQMNKYLSTLDDGSGSFLELLKNLDDDHLSKMTNKLFKRWLNIESDNKLEDGDNPFLVLIDLRLIESLVNEFKEDIAKTPDDMLEIVIQFLSSQSVTRSVGPITVDDSDSDDDSDDEDSDMNSEALPVLLELLSAILTESLSEMTAKTSELLKKVMSSLNKLMECQNHNQQVAANIGAIKSLHSRIKDILTGDQKPASVNDVHKKTLERAITSLNDPLVPIRAHGLFLLRQLIESHSEVVSIDFVTDLHLIQLKDPEPFIYLNVIKGLESLIELDRDQVVKVLVKIYVNEDGTHDVDERLKIGEVLLRFIQSSNELFTGELSGLIANCTISMIRRYDDETKNQDIRIRMSSMSLLGCCCKTNCLGIIDFLTDAIECSLGILQLEKESNSNVMRRAAVVLIHDLILGTSYTEDLPFPNQYQIKVVDTLNYIVDTDEDLLTREQAQIVLDDIKELSELGMEALKEKDQNKWTI